MPRPPRTPASGIDWNNVSGPKPPRRTPCCTRCRRGIRGYGELPCGYPDGCPNENCDHRKKPRLVDVLRHLNDREES